MYFDESYTLKVVRAGIVLIPLKVMFSNMPFT
jgi:hypothetical protein